MGAFKFSLPEPKVVETRSVGVRTLDKIGYPKRLGIASIAFMLTNVEGTLVTYRRFRRPKEEIINSIQVDLECFFIDGTSFRYRTLFLTNDQEEAISEAESSVFQILDVYLNVHHQRYGK